VLSSLDDVEDLPLGDLNRISSSRRLEDETQRNVELMWLTGRLIPDFKTIANFRKDNGRLFALLAGSPSCCRQPTLFSQAAVAVEGSKLKAVNNRDRNFTSANGSWSRSKPTSIATCQCSTRRIRERPRRTEQVVEAEGEDRGFEKAHGAT
jgi:hypothetical protein